ncbi:MAG: hypothetical protein K8I03_12350 [Ignavibacteria bacterium]|nr:hypothetical protein [Ignavibacteria bacterium]
MHIRKSGFCVLLIFTILTLLTSNSSGQDRVNGITIDGVNNLNNIVSSISRHKVRITTRIVFDEWQPASDYTNAVNRIDTVSDIMGEILDSYYMNAYSVQQFKDRVDEYVSAFGSKVDIWEIGNEVNGEWLGNRDSVLAKIMYAYKRVKKMGYRSAVTLYYNKNCWENPQNEMFRWLSESLRDQRKFEPDYVFVSYYEDDCNNLQPNWQQVFDSLHTLFPNSKLGIGECGTMHASRKAEYINRYYKMNITTPNYVGGYFWWYYRQDCVPWNTKPLWQVLEDAMNTNDGIRDGDSY